MVRHFFLNTFDFLYYRSVLTAQWGAVIIYGNYMNGLQSHTTGEQYQLAACVLCAVNLGGAAAAVTLCVVASEGLKLLADSYHSGQRTALDELPMAVIPVLAAYAPMIYPISRLASRLAKKVLDR